ncbi:MAG: Uma2 family endonuclease [Acidobacteria bacterium]|nr:Uma2 family endonuclease [Acidobacteriota bacterium]
MVVVAAKAMTVAEFQARPEERGEFDYELRSGVVVPVTRPKLKHSLLQRRLFKLLEPIVEATGWIDTEVAFRALPENELRVADVAFVRQARFAQADPEDNIQGAPDLVIEVLSPSNSAAEMFDRERLCLENGCEEFWVVDPELRTIRVVRQGAGPVTYGSGAGVPLPMFGGASLAVDAVFEKKG